MCFGLWLNGSNVNPMKNNMALGHIKVDYAMFKACPELIFVCFRRVGVSREEEPMQISLTETVALRWNLF